MHLALPHDRLTGAHNRRRRTTRGTRMRRAARVQGLLCKEEGFELLQLGTDPLS